MAGEVRDTLTLPFPGQWRYNASRLLLSYDGKLIKRDYFSSRPSGIHRATDVPTPNGKLFRAIDEGRISRTGNEGSVGFGRYIMLAHRFPQRSEVVHEFIGAHLQLWIAGEGAAVRQGQSIARTDDSGNSSGPHCHLEWWWKAGDRGSSVDPYWLLVWLTEIRLGRRVHRNPYPTPSKSSVTNQPIQRGEYGYRVLFVQWALKTLALHGHFGSGTQKRLIRFQKEHGIRLTGKVGPVTLDALKKVKRSQW